MLNFIKWLFRSINKGITRHQWLFIGVLGISSFLLGCVGFDKYYAAESALEGYKKISIEIDSSYKLKNFQIKNDPAEGRSIYDFAYLSVQMFALQVGDMPGAKCWEFETARWLSPAVAAYALLLAIASIFYEQINLVKLFFYKRHVIICGLGAKGSMLASKFLNDGKKVVIIESDAHNEHIDHFRDEGAIVINGTANEANALIQARAASARYLIAITGDDGINTEIAVQVNKLMKNTKSSLSSFIHITDSKLCNFFQMNGFQSGEQSNSNMEFFNFYYVGSKLLLNKYPIKNRDKEKQDNCHILIIGLGRIGENLLIDAARSWQKKFHETGNKLKVSIIDINAKNRLKLLTARISELDKICDIKLFQLNIDSEDFLKADFLLDDSGKCIVDKIYISLKHDSECMYAALHLSNFISTLIPETDVPIIAKMNNSRGLGAVLQSQNYENKETGVFKNVKVFSFLEETCTPRLVINGNYERLARAFHAMFVKKKKKAANFSADDPSAAPWEALNEDYRRSHLVLAKNIFIVLKEFGYKVSIKTNWDENLNFPDGAVVRMAARIHNLWVEDRRSAGWKFAPGAKNQHAKTNPNLVDFNQLSEEAKQFDLDVVKALPALLTKSGIQITEQAQKAS